MKSNIKFITTIIAGIIGALLPILGFYSLWSYCISQVPLASEYYGLFKILITLLLLFFGGGITLVLSIWIAIIIGALVAYFLDN